MRVSKPFLLILIFIFGTACTNFTKLYKSGNVSDADFYSEFPFTTRLDLIFIPVEINGETFNFLFDTGAPNVISKELYAKLKLKSLGSGKVGDSQGNSEQNKAVNIDRMSVGGISFNNTAALVIDLKRATLIGCLEIDGIIGSNLMKLAYWKIDSRNNIMTISSRKDTLLAGLSSPIEIPFEPQSTFTPIISLTVNDSIIENITYDTGSGSYLNLGKTVELDKNNFIAAYSGHGSTGIYGTNIEVVSYGKIALKQAGFEQIGYGTYSSNSSKKLLGMEYLSQFVQILDWKLNEIWLYEDEVKQQEFTKFPVIPRWKNGRLLVGSIRSDTIFNITDLQVGDTINVLNGVNFRNSKVIDYCELVFKNDTAIQDTLRMEMIDGEQYEFIREAISLE